jgi:hypothetical protein
MPRIIAVSGLILWVDQVVTIDSRIIGILKPHPAPLFDPTEVWPVWTGTIGRRSRLGSIDWCWL